MRALYEEFDQIAFQIKDRDIKKDNVKRNTLIKRRQKFMSYHCSVLLFCGTVRSALVTRSSILEFYFWVVFLGVYLF